MLVFSIPNILKRSAGIDDRDIVKLSGHKSVNSLSHYNPHNDMEKKIAMAGALMLSKRPLEGLQPSEPGLENDETCLQHIFMSLELPDIGHSIPPLAFVKEEKIA